MGRRSLVAPDWDKRYREGFYNGAKDVHGLLGRFWAAIPDGPVIDVAAGSGRDILFLAGKGFAVCGLDRSTEALRIAGERAAERRDRVFLVCGDADALPFRMGVAAGVLVFYFLSRSAMGEIASLIRNGGIIVYETFLERQNLMDRQRNPDYLLGDGELLSYFRDLEVLFYEETVSISEGKKRAVARFVGRKR
jgi:tellurite methyltransferase